MVALKSSSADTNGHRAIRPRDRVGSFRYFRAGDRWEWSDTVAQMHGYAPGAVEPTTALVMSHNHPDDAAKVALLIEAMAGQRSAVQQQAPHRRHDRAAPATCSSSASNSATTAPLSAVKASTSTSAILARIFRDAAIADFTEHRAQIEQAKGILMAVYGIPAEHAFDILVWRSQETNTKLRTLVQQVIADFTIQLDMPASIRERADHLLLTANKRVGEPLTERASE